MAIYKAITKGSSKLPVGHAQPDKAVKYLMYQSDEIGKYRKDENKKLIPRTEFVTAINVSKDNFCDECRELAKEFGVNQTYSDLKYKHYIQGFNPDDSKLLTKEQCHQMGVEFAKTFFGDFPVLVVTHFEQEAETGGAHWHNHFLVYNCNVHTGRKLDTSGERMREQKRYIITQALAHGLSDRELRMRDGQLLSSRNPDRISSAEYYDRKYHQKLLDKENSLRPADRIKQHTYYTQLQELRIVIASAYRHTGGNQAAFRRYLREVYGVETKTVRGGELSYLHPDRAAPDGKGWVRGRTLGNAYTWEEIQNGNYQSHYRRVIGTGGGAKSTTVRAADGIDSRTDAGIGQFGIADAAEVRAQEPGEEYGPNHTSAHGDVSDYKSAAGDRQSDKTDRTSGGTVEDGRTDAVSEKDRRRKGHGL